MGMGMMGGQPGFDAGQCSCLLYSILHTTHIPSFTLHLLSYLPSVISHHLLSPTTSSLPLPPLSHYLLSLLIPYPYFSSLLCPSRRCIQAGERSLNYEKTRECGGIRREETTRCVVLCVVCQYYCHMKPRYGSYEVGIIKCTCPPNSGSFSLLCLCVSSSSTGDRYPDQIGQEVDLSK
jgi:hypothetical protein